MGGRCQSAGLAGEILPSQPSWLPSPDRPGTGFIAWATAAP